MRARSGSGCWWRASRTTRSSCSAGRGGWRAGTPVPRRSRGTRRRRFWGSTSPCSTRRKTWRAACRNRTCGRPSATAGSKTKDGEDEGWRLRKDGNRFWADTVLTALRDPAGTLIGFGKVTRDLTIRRRTEEQLGQSNAELERFSYSVSHDLRAPLRAINGYAQAVLEDYAAALDAEGKRFLGIIRDSAKRGGELIDALLNFSRLGRQPLSLEPVDLTELARGVVDELRRSVGVEGMDVIVDPLPPTRGDRTLLRQVFANLIGNAFKFTRGRPH